MRLTTIRFARQVTYPCRVNADAQSQPKAIISRRIRQSSTHHRESIKSHLLLVADRFSALLWSDNLFQGRNKAVMIPNSVMMVTATFAKKTKILQVACEKRQFYSILICPYLSRSAIVAAQTTKTSMKWRVSLQRVFTVESYSTVRTGLVMHMIRGGTMRPISKTVRTGSLIFIRPIRLKQGLQKDCESGHKVGRRTETEKTTRTITNLGDHTRGPLNHRD